MVTIDSDHQSVQFTIYQGGSNKIPFEFELDKDGWPLKIGDGTYGVVFACRNKQQELFAVKLFYSPKQGMQLAESRFREEIQANLLIRQNLRLTDRNRNDETANLFHNVIEMVGGTEKFQESSAYKHFQTYFDRLKVSSFAVVTVRYRKTLKQVLEERKSYYTFSATQEPGEFNFPEKDIPFCATKKKLELFVDKRPDNILSKKDKLNIKARIVKRSFCGYEILRQMNFDVRIRTILPFIEDIAEGLTTLHQANFLHLDVKTANILVRGSKLNSFEAVVGDLGFLKPRGYELLETPPLVPGASDNFPLGTRHYRSPEQKDYFDVADAQILVSESELALSISDPKFEDSIIEEGDFVFLNKHKLSFRISEISFSDNFSEPVKVSLDVQGRDLRDRVDSDPRTQVVFYKRQGIRTDLFGFGAITFDLLTCGKSPERFYELIRAYDKEDAKVEEIIEKYVQISSFSLGDTSLSEIFSSFRLKKNSPEYAPREIVALILKCMLYKASGTFYSSWENKHEQAIFSEVLRSIKSLYRQYDPIRGNEENLLYDARLPEGKELETIKSSSEFWGRLEVVVKLPKTDIVYRLVAGIDILDRIIDLVYSALRGEEEIFFAELNSRNIELTGFGLNERLSFKSISYKKPDDYISDLFDDLVYTKITANLRDHFTPQYFTFMRRDIKLKRKPVVETSSANFNQRSNNFAWEYLFQDSSLYGDRIKIGDWILYTDSDKNRLFRIESINKQNKSIALNEILNLEDGFQSQSKKYEPKISGAPSGINAIYYENISPENYYLQMIAKYIYMIFFVGIGNNEPDSLIENILTSISCEELTDQVFISQSNVPSSRASWFRSSKQKSLDLLTEIIDVLVEIYLKSAFPSSSNSYFFLSTQKDQSSIANLRTDIRRVKDLLPALVDPDKYRSWDMLYDKGLQYLKNETSKPSFSLSEISNEKFNFYKSACSKITLATTSKGKFLNDLLRISDNP
ncbi:MAG: hypothetical protein AAF696_12805 [Bacteroidota bacterium]